MATSSPSCPTTFQLIPETATSVSTPNLTDPPGFSGTSVVNTTTPCGVFWPVHPISVLNDLKAAPLSELSHSLSMDTSGASSELVTVMRLVPPTDMLDTVMSCCCCWACA